MYRYRILSTLDVSDEGGTTIVYLDGDTGEPLGFYAPTGQVLGSTISSWLYALHFAAVWGTPYRIFVCLMGVLIAVLSISGVYIWWVKWRSRVGRRRSQARVVAHPQPAETPAHSPEAVLFGSGATTAISKVITTRATGPLS